MNFKQMEFFRKTAELENISQAAKELFIAQPALSKAIKDLEKELGYTLFERIGKQIQLNPSGEVLYKHILRIQSDYSHMENELKELNEQKSGSIYLSFRVASSLLPPLLQSFYEKYPDINLKVYQINQVTKTMPDFDIIIDSQPATPMYSHRELLLQHEKIMVALPTTHPLAQKSQLILADLASEPCALLNEFSSLGKLIRSELAQNFFQPNVIFESDNPYMVRDFLHLNIAYCFVPSKTWEITKHFPNLLLKEVSDLNCERNLYISYGNREYVGKATKAFVRHTKEFFKELAEKAEQ
jgi:DNA-binding transcriptional LysR family regulator